MKLVFFVFFLGQLVDLPFISRTNAQKLPSIAGKALQISKTGVIGAKNDKDTAIIIRAKNSLELENLVSQLYHDIQSDSFSYELNQPDQIDLSNNNYQTLASNNVIDSSTTNNLTDNPVSDILTNFNSF